MTYVPTTQDKLKCAERELRLRKRVYDNRIETGRMSLRKAQREMDCMRAIVADYRALAEKERLL